MVQIGVGMVIIGVLLGAMTFLGLRGTNWDYLLYMLALAGVLYIRTPKEIAGLRLHWKVAALYAVVSSFITLFVGVQRLTGLNFDISLAATFILGGFVFLVLNHLDGPPAPPPME